MKSQAESYGKPEKLLEDQLEATEAKTGIVLCVVVVVVVVVLLLLMMTMTMMMRGRRRRRRGLMVTA